MKKLAIALFLFASTALAGWKAEGPYFGSVTSIAIDPANSDHMWLSTHGGGVWRSTDGGKTWVIASGKILADRVVSYVVLQPKTTGTLFAGADGGAMAMSKDGGDTWKWVMTDLAQTPHPIVFDPNNAKAIWVPDVNLHKKSIDGGAKWTEFRISGGDAYTFTFDPKDSKTIWAGGVNGRSGLWRSSDGGASWKQMGTGLPEMNRANRIVIDPSNTSTMYMATPRGAFKSTDGGASWTAFGGGFPDAEPESLAMSPANPKVLFSGTKKGFWKTTNGGDTWTQIGGGFPYYVARTVVFDPKTPDVMWVGTGIGIFKSADGGKTWTASNGGLSASWIEKVWAGTAGPIFAQTSQGLFRSDGRGGWSEVLKPFSDDEANLDQIVYDARNPRVVHVANGGFYYRSDDSGTTWKRINASFQDPDPTFRTMALDPANPKVLYTADSNANDNDPPIFKSTDGGVKWKPASKGVSGGVISLLSTPSGLFALGQKGGLWRSTDGASTWTKLGEGLPTEDVRAIAASDAGVFVATKDGVYRSADSGATFKKADKRDTEAVVVDDKGAVYIGTDEGVVRSTDGGKTFTPFNDGLTNHDVRALFNSGTRLYAGTAGGGVFSIDLP